MSRRKVERVFLFSPTGDEPHVTLLTAPDGGYFPMNDVARRKLNAPPEWEWYRLEAIGDDTLVEGGVPSNPNHRAPRRWKGVKGQRVVVTDAEANAARMEFERSTSLCWRCGGSGKTMRSVSQREPDKVIWTFRTCDRCKGSGASSPLEPNP